MRKKLVKIMALAVIIVLSFSINVLAGESKQYEIGDTCETMIEKWFGEEIVLLETTPVQEALDKYFEVRRASLFDDSAVEGEFMSEAIKKLENERRAGFNKFENNTNSKIYNAANNVDIKSVVEKDGLYYVEAYEWIFFDYDSLNVEGYAVNVSGFGVEHEIVLDKNYVITGDKYDEAELSGICTKEKKNAVEEVTVADEAEDDDSAELFAAFYTGYNVNAAVSYSDTYALKYNTAYANFNSLGGDCANFTSQCIYAGGMPQVVGTKYGKDGWFYVTSTNRSATWTSAGSLRTWMANNRGVLVNSPSDSQIYTGSPVFYDWDKNGTYDHAAFCVGKNAEGVPVINSHNADYYHLVWHYNGKSSTNYSTVQLTSGNGPTITAGDVNGTLKWTINSNGVLEISGTGDITLEYTPWRDNLNYRNQIKTIVICDGITNIGNFTFAKIEGATSVTIPSSVKTIQTQAFDGCTALKSVSIPEGVESIGNFAFDNCTSLQTIKIPESVKFIGGDAFHNTGLTSVTVRADVEYGVGVYSYCKSLENVTIEDGVTVIAQDLFWDTEFTSVTIPGSVMQIKAYAFGSCENLADVYLSVSKSEWEKNVTVGADAFPAGVTFHYAEDIAEGKFGNITWVIDPNGNLTIEGTGEMTQTPWIDYADDIKSVYISYGITNIAEYAFDSCAQMESIIIEPGVTKIESSAFYGCKKLTSVEIPFTVTSIGGSAFRNCSALTDIYLNLTKEEWAEKVTVGSNAFPGTATLHYAPPAVEFSIVENKDGRVTFGWNHDETSISYLITVSEIDGDYYKSYEFSAEDARKGKFEITFALEKGSYTAIVTCMHPNIMFAGGEIAFDVTEDYIQPEIDLEAEADGLDVTVKWNHIDADKYILTIFDSEGNDVESYEAEVKDAIGGKFYFDCTLEKGYYKACMTVMYPQVIAPISEIQFSVAINDSENYSVEYLSGEVKNGKFYAEVEVVNLTDREEADTVVIAVYKNDEMIDYVYMKMDLPKDETVTFGGMLEGAEGAKLKAFVWDSIKGMKALSNVVEK